MNRKEEGEEGREEDLCRCTPESGDGCDWSSVDFELEMAGDRDGGGEYAFAVRVRESRDLQVGRRPGAAGECMVKLRLG